MAQAPLYSYEECHPLFATDRQTYSLPAVASFNIGNGLVEIAALTSLVGSATAQKLVLGNKGPAGIVWATMTIFGGMSIVKSGIATATPAWLRDSLGVRGGETDDAIGLSMNLDRKGIRRKFASNTARGIECEIQNKAEPLLIGRRDVHVFNQRTAYALDAFSACQPGEGLKIYSFVQEAYRRELNVRNVWEDQLYLIASSVKLVEVGLLWSYGADLLAAVALVTWLFFLLAAILLLVYGYSLERANSTLASEVDYVAGALPTPTKVGGERKVILGTPNHPRGHLVWKLFWAFSCLAMTASVVASYVALGQLQDSRAFAIWTGFQILWLVLRSVFYHVVEDRERPYLANLPGVPWSKVGIQQRARVRHLVYALAKYQQQIHPRGPWSYGEEAEGVEAFAFESMQMEFSLPPATPSGTSIPITIHGVIGDPTLTSVSWLFGFKRGGFDMYDTCIVLLDLKETTIAIPAVRVLSGWRPDSTTDPEPGHETERPLRGSSNLGDRIEWWYWIPCVDGQWMYFRSENLKSKGLRRATVVSDEQITESLERGDLFISMQHVDEVKEALSNSRQASEYLLELLE